MLKKVLYPPNVRHGIRPLEGGNTGLSKARVFGGDTETVRGKAYTVQVAGPDDSTLVYVTPETAFVEFWSWIRSRLTSEGVNICYFHNLNFDLRVLFNPWAKEIYDQRHEVELEVGRNVFANDGIKVKMLFGKVNVAHISDEHDRKLTLYDSMAFTQAGLARSLRMYSIPFQKLPAPKGLGRDALCGPEFEAYAMQDALAVRALGEKILDFHARYDVKPSMTLPSFTARVFRRKFLLRGERIPFPPDAVARAAELSYHGGKNGYYLAEPACMEDVYEVDISSAYPFAMTNFPPLTEGQYIEVDRYVPRVAGVYLLSGNTGAYRYPLVFSHDFKPVKAQTDFSEVWTYSHEVELLLQTDAPIKVIKGYVWLPGSGARNPFARYVKHFYDMKESVGKADPLYHFAKIALNGLYGKLVASNPKLSEEQKEVIAYLRGMKLPIGSDLNVDGVIDPRTKKRIALRPEWTAGAFYSPFWASFVTSHTRAYLYKLETKLHALHAATDSVKATTPHEAVKGLGGLKIECFGRCYLFRNKLYLHFSRDSTYCGHKEPPYKAPDGTPLVEDGQHLCKVGMHGFKGQVHELFTARHRLLVEHRLAYSYEHCVGLREGIRRKEQPCDFVPRHEVLELRRKGC